MLTLEERKRQEAALRQTLIEFAPKLDRLNTLEADLQRARTTFEIWFVKKYAAELAEVRQLRDELVKVREWFNQEAARLYFAGQKDFFDRSVQPRTIIKVRYDNEAEFIEWAKQFTETYDVDTHAKPRKAVADYLKLQGRMDLLVVDIDKAEKLAASVYDNESLTPVYDGPFTIEPTISQTSEDKFIKLVTTFGVEQDFDDRQFEGGGPGDHAPDDFLNERLFPDD